MAWTKVQGAVQTTIGGLGTTTNTGAFGSNVTAGNLLIVAGFTSSGLNGEPTDSVGTPYTEAGTTLNGSFIHYGIAGGGGANTVSLHFLTNNSVTTLWLWEFSGNASSSPLDKTAQNSGSGTALSSGNTATTTNANELLFGLLVPAGGITTPVESGWTQIIDTANSGTATQYDIVSSTGAYAATGTASPTGAWVAIIATFLPGAGVTDLNATVAFAPDTVLSFTPQLALKPGGPVLPGTSLTIGATLTQPDVAALAPQTVQTLTAGKLDKSGATFPLQNVLGLTANLTGPTLLSGTNAPTPATVVTPRPRNIHGPQIYI